MTKNKKTKGFKWTGWIKAAAIASFPNGHHVISVESGKMWDINSDGEKLYCELSDSKAKSCKNCGGYRL